MKEFAPPLKPNGFSQENAHTTTLVVESIPSQVGFEIVEAALSASEQLTREELASRVNQRLNEEYTVLSSEELENLLKLCVKYSLRDIVEPETIYMEPQEEFTEESNIHRDEEEKDEFGRTPYIRRLIEEAKAEMCLNRNNEITECDQKPTPPPFHMWN